MVLFNFLQLPLAKTSIDGTEQRWKRVRYAGVNGVAPLPLGSLMQSITVTGRLPRIVGGIFQGTSYYSKSGLEYLKAFNITGPLEIHGVDFGTAKVARVSFSDFRTVEPGTASDLKQTCRYTVEFTLKFKFVDSV